MLLCPYFVPVRTVVLVLFVVRFSSDSAWSTYLDRCSIALPAIPIRIRIFASIELCYHVLLQLVSTEFSI